MGNAEGVKAKGKRCDSRIRSKSHVVINIEDVARERMTDARTTEAKAGTRGGTLEVALERHEAGASDDKQTADATRKPLCVRVKKRRDGGCGGKSRLS